MLLLPEISYESYLENFTHRRLMTARRSCIFWTCLISPAVKSSAKSHLHVFSYIYPFLPPLIFASSVLSYFFSFVSFRHMTLCIPPALNDKDTQMPRIAPCLSFRAILAVQCRADPDSFGGEKQREREKMGSVVFEGGGLPYQLNCSRDRQRCVGNSENQKKDFTCHYSQIAAAKRIPRGKFYGSEIALSRDSGVLSYVSFKY